MTVLPAVLTSRVHVGLSCHRGNAGPQYNAAPFGYTTAPTCTEVFLHPSPSDSGNGRMHVTQIDSQGKSFLLFYIILHQLPSFEPSKEEMKEQTEAVL